MSELTVGVEPCPHCRRDNYSLGDNPVVTCAYCGKEYADPVEVRTGLVQHIPEEDMDMLRQAPRSRYVQRAESHAVENATDAWKGRALRAEQQLDHANARIAQLTDRLLTPRQETQYVPQALPWLPDEIRGAILDRAGSLSNDLGRQLAAYALNRVAAKEPVESIVEMITKGEEGE